MFDSTSFTPSMLSNPTLLATTIINAMESADTTLGTVSINDPNNGFVMQLFAGISMFSNFSQKIDEANSYFYPQRARNAAQLYSHLSQFDYTELMASPATLPFIFDMSKDWIVANAVPYTTNYNKIEIPSTSFITLGGIVYSMYYPIEILVNTITGAVTAYYDTSVTNPLNTLSSNMLLSVQEFTKDGINWFRMQFNTYQFKMTPSTYSVGSEQGFNKNISYEDQFYAVNVLYQNPDSSWSNFTISLSEQFYDYTTPTAIITLLTDSSQINITIPQIYFDNNQITSTIKVELYTSKGSVNYALSDADVAALTTDFDTSSSPYAAPLAQMPSWYIVPVAITVVGGSNPMTYSQIRDAVVNQGLYNRVPITEQELTTAGNKAGFVITKVQDDLTERMYFASNVLTDTNSIIIPTFSGSILIEGNSLSGDPSSILNFSDGYYTILPTTTFIIPNNGTVCVPLTNAQVSALAALSPADLVTELNRGVYVRQPFHITMITTPKSPSTKVYNLMSPTMSNLMFIAENANSAPQMSVTSCSVIHQNNGTGGYLVNLGVVRSINIQSDNAANYQVILTCIDVLGDKVYLPATYVSTVNNVDIWQLVIATSYHINQNDNITVMMYNKYDVLSSVDISIAQTFNVLTSFSSSYNTSIPKDSGLNSLLPASLQSSLTVMANQTMTLNLGTDLTNMIYSAINTTWGNNVYETAPTDVYYKTTSPIFQTDSNGVIVTRLNHSTNSIEVVQIYPSGATPSSTLDIVTKTTTSVNTPSSGTTTLLNITDITGILVGMPVRGLNIPVGTVVTDVMGSTVTLSNLITSSIPSNSEITFTNAEIITTTSAAQTAPGVQLTVATTAGMIPGQSVFGFDIPPNSVIATVDSPTQFSLNNPTTVSVSLGCVLTIINTLVHGVVKVSAGSVVTDSSGNPIIIQDAQNQYRIPTILFDGRIFASTDPTDQATISSIHNTVAEYAVQTSTIAAGLPESSQVYYIPSRSMGYATFGVGNSQTVSMSLELSFVVNLYVTQAVYNNQPLRSTMEDSILSTINAGIQNPTISISDITDSIKTALDTNATGVELGGINGNNNLRLIALQDTNVIPCVEYTLVSNADGTISRTPNITINFIPAPTTAGSSSSAAV